MLSNNECIYGTDHVSIDAVFKYNPKMHNVVVVNKDEEFLCRAGAVGDDTYTYGYEKLELGSQGPMYASRTAWRSARNSSLASSS